MIFKPTKLAGAHVIELERHGDERGYFARTFCEREFAEHGLPTHYPQCNTSFNSRAGTLRGMHFQAAPQREAKLVRCTRGAIYDVIVDLRVDSPTRFEWIGVDLTEDNGTALFIPEGFAHGFLTRADTTEVHYHMSDFHRPQGARGVRWDDPRFSIRWPITPSVISERDATYPDFDPARFDG
jgi:dTDP-4-dehydrorhamnose 3,5-epimerase